MFDWKNFINQIKEARNPKETIDSLERLANHPNTEKPLAAAAKRKAIELRKKHNLFDRNEKTNKTDNTKNTNEYYPPEKVWKYHKQTYGMNAQTTFGHIHRKNGKYYTEFQIKHGGPVFKGEHASFDDAHNHLHTHHFRMSSGKL